jgi:hypothetical protein
VAGVIHKTRHIVMPGLVPGIHVFAASIKKDVDGRDKPGHDEGTGALSAGTIRP